MRISFNARRLVFFCSAVDELMVRRTSLFQFFGQFFKLILLLFFFVSFLSVSGHSIHIIVTVNTFLRNFGKLHKQQFANTIEIPLRLRCMHLCECQKCNKVSLHAAYRLTFCENRFFFLSLSLSRFIWIRVCLRFFPLLLYISTFFFSLLSSLFFAVILLPLFLFDFFFLLICPLLFFFVRNDVFVCVCLSNVYIFLIRTLFFHFCTCLSLFELDYSFFIWHSTFYAVFFLNSMCQRKCLHEFQEFHSVLCCWTVSGCQKKNFNQPLTGLIKSECIDERKTQFWHFNAVPVSRVLCIYADARILISDDRKVKQVFISI